MSVVTHDGLATRYINVLGRDIHYRPGTADEQVIEDVFEHRYHIPPPEVNPQTVLDCGAHIGLTMCDYRRLWPDATIFGIEMDAENAVIARMNTDDPVLVAAVGAVSGIGHYLPDVQNWAYRLEPDGPSFVVKLTLRELIGTARIDFLKLDIEGEERDLIQCRDGLAQVDSLLVELHNGYTPAEAIDDLEACGFGACVHGTHPKGAVWAWRP
jgi:FkbM family methyltransferase